MIATTLSVILFLAATYGGEIQAHNLVFRSPQACAAFVSTLERATIRHTIIRPCDPPMPVMPTPIPPPERTAPES